MRDERFESLQRLVRLKQHEVPPPAFFRDFSTRVIDRIEREARTRKTSWWRHWLPFLDAPKLMAGASALTLAGLAFVGISLGLVLTSDSESGMTALNEPSGNPMDHSLAGFGPRTFSAQGMESAMQRIQPFSVEGAVLEIEIPRGRNEEKPPTNLFAIPSSRGRIIQQVSFPVYAPAFGR
jgi:hypothetical protein